MESPLSDTKTPSPFVWVVHPDEVGRPATTAPRPAGVAAHPASEQPSPTTSAQSRAVLPSALITCAQGHYSAARSLCDALAARADVGIARYGTPLQTHNGRDAIRDLREELLDAIMYATQAHLEGRITEDQAQEIIDALAYAYQIIQEAKP